MFTLKQKRDLIEQVTDATVSIEAEVMRGVTWVVVEQLSVGYWRPAPDQRLTSAGGRRLQAGGG